MTIGGIKLEDVAQIALDRAWLCADLECRTISNTPGYCPKCAGTEGRHIVEWLDELTKERDAGGKA